MFEKSPAGVRRRKSVCDRERGLLAGGGGGGSDSILSLKL